jgi:hypothetical protein
MAFGMVGAICHIVAVHACRSRGAAQSDDGRDQVDVDLQQLEVACHLAQFLTLACAAFVFLFSTVAMAETKPAEVKIKWKGDYAHNSDKHSSKDNPYDSGFSKNFKNGTPQEFGDVQKEGELNAFVYSPKDAKAAFHGAPMLSICTHKLELADCEGAPVSYILGSRR